MNNFKINLETGPSPTKSPNENLFAWFGGSKIIDKKGNPKPYYHGVKYANEPFQVFDLSKARTDVLPQNALGFFFSHSKITATAYADGGEPVAVYLRIINPYQLKGREFLDLDTREKVEAFKATIVKQGHDGISIEDGVEVVAFEPNQIKTVNNNETYDPENPNIYL